MVSQGESYRFGAAGNPQLGQDAADMRFDRGWTNSKPSGDLRIVQPLDH